MKYYIFSVIFFIINHLAFSQDKAKFYDKIIIINEENSKKNEIAKLIEIAKNEKARIIGLNIYFTVKDSLGDSLLKNAIQDCSNLIMPTLETNDKKDGITYYPTYGYKGDDNASDYIVVNKNKSTHFDTFLQISDSENKITFVSYIVELAFQYDSLQTRKFLKKKIAQSKDYSVKIKYSINEKGFQIISKKDILSGNYPKDIFKDKIVLIGYLDPKGSTLYKTGNRKYPKMHGVIIDANIIKQILEEK